MSRRHLNRLPEFDERSRSYPIRALVADRVLRSYTWRCSTYLDQGVEGQCVGFSIAHEIAARPVELPATVELAGSIYRRAQQLDEWEGEDYDGTSVLAGMKTAQEMGYFGTYRWAFSLQDLMLAVGYRGPAVLGLNWYEGMLDVDEDGVVHPTGDVVGGHAILCRGVSLSRQQFLLHNSWGPNWGMGGCCAISFDALGYLLAENGEAAIPEMRQYPASGISAQAVRS